MSLKYCDAVSSECIEKLRKYTAAIGARAYVKTFGCQQNVSDSEKVCGILRELGYSFTEDASEADLIILNTCSVRARAEDKVFSLLGNYKPYKDGRPDIIIGVIGCMGSNSSAAEIIRKKFKYVNFTLGAGAMHKIPSVLEAVIEGERVFVPPQERECIVEGIPTVRGDSKCAYVSIMYGCNNFCSYCIVPYTRGRERSRDSEDILAECRELIAGGAREIMLLGQNVNSYSADMDFPELLSAVAGLSGDFTVRFMTSHPKDVSDRLIEVIRDNPDKIAPAFHLPLQSGSDRILLDMNRKYDREGFIETAEKIRSANPDIALTTDVIVGYPSEEEEDFIATLDVLSKVRFDSVYAFIYSPRAGTRAAKRTDTVSEQTKKERIGRLLEMQDEIALGINQKLVGKKLSVFVQDKNPDENGIYTGRTASGKLVHFSSERGVFSDYIKVNITSVGPYILKGSAAV